MLEKSETPAIVIVNSLLSIQPEPHMVATSAARAGVQNLAKSLAGEFAPHIRVNSILLGLIDSGQWQRRFEAREDKSITREHWFADLARKKGIPLPARPTGRSRARNRVPRLACCELHHRRQPRSLRRRLAPHLKEQAHDG